MNNTSLVVLKKDFEDEQPSALSVFVMQLIIDKLMKFLEDDQSSDEIVVTEIPLESSKLKSNDYSRYDYDL